jgi:hypothetical protein
MPIFLSQRENPFCISVGACRTHYRESKDKIGSWHSPKAAILAVDRRSQARSAFQANLIFLKRVGATVFLSETLQIARTNINASQTAISGCPASDDSAISGQ